MARLAAHRLVVAQRRLLAQGASFQSRRHWIHCSRRSLDDVPGHRHPAFKLSARSDTVAEHNQNNDDQSKRTDAPRALRAARALQTGETVHQFHPSVVLGPEASHWTLQIGATEHVDLSHHVLRNINHACKPNVKLDGLKFEALCNIAKNDELFLDYNASEYDLQGGTFVCACGAVDCVGEVRGWAYLDEAQRSARQERCQPWLLNAKSRSR
jgi:hypothetical protein